MAGPLDAKLAGEPLRGRRVFYAEANQRRMGEHRPLRNVLGGYLNVLIS
jgi:hypothetical protein